MAEEAPAAVVVSLTDDKSKENIVHSDVKLFNKWSFDSSEVQVFHLSLSPYLSLYMYCRICVFLYLGPFASVSLSLSVLEKVLILLWLINSWGRFSNSR